MALPLLKILLFALGGTAAAGSVAYYSGALDPYLEDQAPEVVAKPEAGEPAADAKDARLAAPEGGAPAAEEQATAGSAGTGAESSAAAPASEGAAPASGEVAVPPAEQAPADSDDAQQSAALQPAPEPSEALPQPEQPEPQAEAPQATAPADGAAGSSQAPAASEQPAGQGVMAPTFDLVRVEPDGSMVIAGRAAAGALVEIMSGSHKIGEARASESGDFVVILDQPLKPGDYQLVLRSTEPSGASATSQETAVVSVPDTPAGQVLALVEQPGEASRLITVPEPPSAEPKAAQEPSDETGEASATGEAPATAGEAPATTGEAPAAPADAGEPSGQAVAAADPAAKTEEAQPGPAGAQPAVVVAAVEIEGRHVFVAGSADPGRLVRIYANEILLGQARASEGGRYLVEAERDLPVGDYIIRADALGPDGAEVVARAAVPFEREPGETIAAVAPSATAETGAESKPAEAPQPQAVAPAAEKPAEAAPEQQASVPQTAPEAAHAQQPRTQEPASAAAQPASEPAAAPQESLGAAEGNSSETAAPSVAAATPASTEVEAQTALSPKLRAVDNAVIIRRGDTLWRISRRVYGHGVRYSTIYLANRDQIESPHKIWPGQVFAMPEKTEQGEVADWDALGDQITPLPPAQQNP